MQTHHPKVDYLFAGAGASATLVLMSMEKHGLLKGKNILILDPDSKFQNDKTYCFWSEQNEEIILNCQHLVSHHWDEVSVNRKKSESLSPKKYYHISSLDVYEELRRIIDVHKIQRIYTSVTKLEADTNGVNVITDSGTWNAELVFDSRTPKYLPLKETDVHLFQSFIGYVILTENPLPSAKCIDLMDFNVDQQGHTQFMYILPHSSNKALVELTRFGLDQITKNEADLILQEYIQQRLGNYQVLTTEIGCIPMSTASIVNDSIPGVIAIGGRGGAVKPSTGYAFKNMFNHAERISAHLKNNDQPKNIPNLKRFQFYDRLLLLILSRTPFIGKLIFQKLFNNNDTKNILAFLDEKTNILQDIRIFLTLPKKPFLKAVGWSISSRFRGIIRPFFIFILAILLLPIYSAYPNDFDFIQIVFFSVGMFVIGIPHGAIDHLVEARNFKSKIKPSFVIRYLGLALINFIFWMYSPLFALIFFLLYSAIHFGQTDFQEWQIRKSSLLKNIFWGGIVLVIILFGHLIETNYVLRNMHVGEISFNDLDAKLISVMLALIATVWAIIMRKWTMLLSVLMLLVSIKLPLITSFGLYFICQHSMNGWSHLKQGLKIDNKKLFIKALPFSFGAVFLFSVMLYLLKNNYFSTFNGHWLTILFVFISCISFPHVVAMSNFYNISLRESKKL